MNKAKEKKLKFAKMQNAAHWMCRWMCKVARQNKKLKNQVERRLKWSWHVRCRQEDYEGRRVMEMKVHKGEEEDGWIE